MSYIILEKKSSEIKFEITVEALKLKKVTDLVALELGKSVKVSGFRPGKAPRFMIEKEIGKDRFWAEVIDKVIPEAYYETIIKENLTAISQPQIEVKSFVPDQSLVFMASVAMLPEIKELKYKNLNVKKIVIKVSEMFCFYYPLTINKGYCNEVKRFL